MSRQPLDPAFRAAMDAWIADGLPIGEEPDPFVKMPADSRAIIYGGASFDVAIPGLTQQRQDAAEQGSHIHRRWSKP